MKKHMIKFFLLAMILSSAYCSIIELRQNENPDLIIKKDEVIINDFDDSLNTNIEYESERIKREGRCHSRESTISIENRNGKEEKIKQYYCIWNPRSKSRHIVYFFHGMLLSEQHWYQSEKNKFISREWLKNLRHAPTVVSVSYGPASLINPEPLTDFKGRAFLFSSKNNDAKRSELLKDFQKNFMPHLEKRLGKIWPKRHLMSVSMGGFNSAQLLVRKPKDFTSAIFICPAVNPDGPYSIYKMAKYYVTNKPSLKYYFYALYLSKYYFPDYKDWKDDSPMPIFKKSRKRFPPIYISSSRLDEFGFFSGGKYFADLAMAKGSDIQFSEEGEFHCDFDPQKVADFSIKQFQ